MAYMHIPNLYKSKTILAFRRVYALEKIHGTSAHIRWRDGELGFYAGGVKHEPFVALFDQDELVRRFTELGHAQVVVFGEAYGGKCQGMSKVYGPDLRFVAFEVKIGEAWLAVPDAAQVVDGLALEFVDYVDITTDLDVIDAARDAPSVQAMRNGMGEHPREGVVLRPPFEVITSNGKRVIAKHKTEAYQERRKHPPIGEKLEVLKQADAIAQEWVTPMRLTHVLDSLAIAGEAPNIERTRDVIMAMLADVEREAEGEIEMSKMARKAIGGRTAQLFKARLQEALHAGLRV